MTYLQLVCGVKVVARFRPHSHKEHGCIEQEEKDIDGPYLEFDTCEVSFNDPPLVCII